MNEWLSTPCAMYFVRPEMACKHSVYVCATSRLAKVQVYSCSLRAAAARTHARLSAERLFFILSSTGCSVCLNRRTAQVQLRCSRKCNSHCSGWSARVRPRRRRQVQPSGRDCQELGQTGLRQTVQQADMAC